MSNGAKKIKNRSRKWLFTINNPETHGYSHESIKNFLGMIENLDYWCICDEIGGKTSCYHTHVFIFRKKSGIEFSYMKKLFPTAHFDYPLGTAEENRNYIRKEGKYENSEKALTNLKDTFEEFGECPHEEQGKRNDLNGLYGMIKDGLTDYEILEENPSYMTKLDTVGRVRELLRYEEFRNKRRTEMQVEYWTGASGAGKTKKIMDTYGDSNVYRVTDYKHPWDTYRGQDIVVFEEFYGERFELPDMLNWLDIYPIDLPCRYNNKTACFTKVFLTSNKPLEEQYTSWQRNESESWKAFLRRIHCIKVFDENGHIKEYKTLEEFKQRFIEVDENTKLPWDVDTKKSYTECIGYINLGDCKFCKHFMTDFVNCPYDRKEKK